MTAAADEPFPTIRGPEYSADLAGLNWQKFSRLAAVKGAFDAFARDIARRQVDEGEPVDHAVLQFTSWAFIELERSFADATADLRTDNPGHLSNSQMSELLLEADRVIGTVAAEAGRMFGPHPGEGAAKGLTLTEDYLIDSVRRSFENQRLAWSWNMPRDPEGE